MLKQHTVPHTPIPHTPRPPTTPSQSLPVFVCEGLQLRLFTSTSELHHAIGLRSCSTPFSGFPPDVTLFPPLPSISHASTSQSSPPAASTPRLPGFHSQQFTGALCPFNSTSAWPGCLTSRILTTGESTQNVAIRCCSCGEAANRSRAGGALLLTGEPPSRSLAAELDGVLFPPGS